MLLRSANHSDAAEIAQIYLASRKKFLHFAPLVHSDEEVRLWVRDTLLPTASLTLAVVDGATVGFVATLCSGSILWIDQLYIRPESVGQGVGAALLRSALAGARENPVLGPPGAANQSPSVGLARYDESGCMAKQVRLYTFQANTGARQFYERFGFVPIELTDGEANEEKCPDVLYELSKHARSDG
ncbi:GNAT family N-acetyltransferase [Paucibacter sp. B2R-40]|uniref:GNAT family N-acetyltransferase n=1 Tax=Paucibacter sp. B2R-40 TaxID=2893554 RepID=UPI0021E5030C|nr:GNAT family N-acetyltransferase [Paucibacter sp. B2R-40]MCV2356918.1 GNAT family N-acetyltransferase [Paucibacter sp. B2R-40]